MKDKFEIAKFDDIGLIIVPESSCFLNLGNKTNDAK